jgi:hypothetical protein
VDEAIVTPFSARFWLRIAAVSLALISATPGQAEAEAYTPVEFWNTQILDGIRQGLGSTPTMSSYDAATLDVAIYNAVNAASGLPGQPYAGTPAPVGGAEAGAAAYWAGRTVADRIYAGSPTIFLAADAYAAPRGYLDPTPGSAIAKGAALGIAAGEAMLTAWQANNDTLGMMPIDLGSTEVGKWRATLPSLSAGVTPDWGKATPFVIGSGQDFIAAVPPTIPGSSRYQSDLAQVQCLGGPTLNTATYCTGTNLVTQAQKDANTRTGLFWSNDQNGTYKPPGQWIEATVLTTRTLGAALSLFDQSRLFALVTTGMADSAIAQWQTKYLFDVWRPVTAVNDPTNPNKPGSYWWPAVDSSFSDPATRTEHDTPPFPSYGSGHSTFGAVVATIYAGFFGTDRPDFTFRVCSDTMLYTASTADDCRTYDSFKAASEENGLSRIYAGFHFGFDNTGAQAVGNEVGAYILANAFTVPAPGALALLPALIALLGVRRFRAG